MVRWLVTGAHGMLGRDVVARLAADGGQVVALDRDELDILDPAAVARGVAGADVVVNCAAFTDVDGAETAEGAAFAVNAVGPRNLALATARAGVSFVQISTDYVFDGAASGPYPADAPTAPVGAYGRTKAAGEWAVRAEHPGALIVRTAWLYGAHGRCFPRTIAAAAGARDHLDVVDDQVGQPTWTVDLADLIVRLIAVRAPGGIYHGTAGGSTSWWGFARAVVESAGRDPGMVRPMPSSRLDRPAPRPANSVLTHGALAAIGVEPIGDWESRWKAAAPVVLA